MSETRAAFRKSSYSGAANSNCVEVAVHRDKVVVSGTFSSEGPSGRSLSEEWDAFVEGAKDGEFDGLV